MGNVSMPRSERDIQSVRGNTGITDPRCEAARESEHSAGCNVPPFFRLHNPPACRLPSRARGSATLYSPVTQFSPAMRPSRRIATVNTAKPLDNTRRRWGPPRSVPPRAAPPRHYSEITPPCSVRDTRGATRARADDSPSSAILFRRIIGSCGAADSEASSSASVHPPAPFRSLPDVSVFPDSSRDSPR